MKSTARTLQSLIQDRQHNRVLRLSFINDDAPDAELLVNRLDASEALSRDFSYTLELLSDDPHIELKAMLGKLLCVELIRSDGCARFFTGYVDQFRFKRSDGNLAFYEAHLVPWLAFLKERMDCRVFHQLSLQDLTAAVFAEHGGLAAWDCTLHHDDPIVTERFQFNESQANFLHRRWEMLGWHYHYEHGPTGHVLKLSDDSTYAAAIDGRPEVPFQRHGGAAEEAAIWEWSPFRQFAASTVARSSYDIKNPRPQHVSVPTINQQGAVPSIESYQYAGAYGFSSLQDGDRVCKVLAEGIEAAAKRFDARGNCPYLQPGRWQRLTGHFDEDWSPQRDKPHDEQDHEFLVISVEHCATNNYLQDADAASAYTNTAVCIRKKIPWHPEQGYNSEATRIYGLQTATVVGPAGQNIFVDHFGRVKVQFHWDRHGKNNQDSSAWIRVSSGWAGAQQGIIAIPRSGQLVIVQWLDGNCDRPIITGSVISQDNMPPWALPSQSALSGIRSRELAPKGGNAVGGRSNHLIFDDSNNAIQAQLKSDAFDSMLSLGSITRINNNAGRQDRRGSGFELRSDAQGVLRSHGMLLTTEARPKGAAHTTDMGETVSRLTQSRDLHEQLADLAQTHEAQHEQADQQDVAKAIKAQNEAIKGSGGDFPELAEPHLVLASPSGIESSSAASTHLASADHTALTAGGHVSVATGKSFFAAVQDLWSVYVHKLGVKLIAASGKVSIQAQSDNLELLAQKVLDIISTHDWINLKAKLGIRLNGGGSEIVLSGDGIKEYTPGGHEVHAADHQTFGPQARPLHFPGQLPNHDICIPCLLKAAQQKLARANPA
ncbi:type VI secretion system Vgr family protein [Collimonas sp. OK412]|jgi:type VI secretion system secreted protein VgrG|uniref:type VI secretion system Vgr family protein n=1 Tax=Collimonas sp. (strain OK412) TaxID=1801619 RepID=UPI0008EBB47A|nr:type VI secretion system Vgr family protein [Collimonas sp. OK412]SFD10976.1 type VI secretion system secreted protein VgrG [Collimonas sp. OK412]